AIGILPGQTMAGAALVLGAKGNLAMTDGFAVHVGLEHAFHRRIGRIVDRGTIGAAPHKTIAHRHAAAIDTLRDHAVQHLALAVQQPGSFRPTVMTLLLYPETAPLRIGCDGIGPAA